MRAAAGLQADDLVERRPSVIFDLEDTTLRFEGKKIRFPAAAREALDTVAGFARPFTVAEANLKRSTNTAASCSFGVWSARVSAICDAA